MPGVRFVAVDKLEEKYKLVDELADLNVGKYSKTFSIVKRRMLFYGWL